MANILGFIYMSVLFLFCICYMAFLIYDWIYRMKSRKRTPAIREPEIPVKPLPSVDVVGKSTTAFLAPLISASIEPMMSEKLETELKSSAETEQEVLPEDVEADLKTPYIPDEGGNYFLPLSRVLLIMNGETVYERNINANSFAESVDVFVKPGDFIRMEVDGTETETRKLDGPSFDTSAPFAFTNPIFFRKK